MGLFGDSIEALKDRGDVAALLDIVEQGKGRKSRRAFEALEALDDASFGALSLELRADHPPRAYATALVLASVAQRGSMEAKLALLGNVRDPRNAAAVGVALNALKDERDKTLPGLTDAVLAFLEGPVCLLECPRDPAVFDEQPTRMTRRQILDGFMEIDSEERTSQLLPAFQIIENGEEPRAIPFLARALSWRDPTLVAHEDSLLAKGQIEFGRHQHRADEHVRVAAARALGSTLDSSAFAPLVSALEDDSYDVRIAAAESLSTIGVTCDEVAPGVLAALKRLVIVPDPRYPEDADDPRATFASKNAEVRAVACREIALLSWLDDSVLLDELLASDNELIRRAAAEGQRRDQQMTWDLHHPATSNDVKGGS